jgi:DMSO/TMAO reductase YedYZ molybdopterin-dependent catalytic subunit
MRRLTRRALLVGGAAALAGVAGWRWLLTRPADDDLPWPLRSVLRFNERVNRGLLGTDRLAPTFPPERAGRPRPNGHYGAPAAAADWRLRVESPGRRERVFTRDDLRGLERVEMVTELKCIEGWSQVVRWGGVRLLDFVNRHGLATRSGQPADPHARPDDLFPFVYLATPDGGYDVALDAASALHPQTLLCDTMGGEPLSPEHGAPVRLVTTVKYGIKNIKWLGLIRFQDRRPTDFWTERGYDWYAGL